MKRKYKIAGARIGILFLVISIIGCGGGGGGTGGDGGTDNPPTTSPSLQVLPTSFDFGTVTINNTPAPLEVKLNNNGSAALNVSNIALSDLTNFSLNFNGGESPCGSSSPTIAAGATCTFEVSFQPTQNSSFSANVQINSNLSGSPSFLQLSGISEPVITLNVKINQAEITCGSSDVTAYVSVFDQGGYPITTLTNNDFSVFTNGSLIPILPVSSSFVSNVIAPISLALVMDYSSSITNECLDCVNDMQNGLVEFIQSLQSTDEAEIIKFDSGFSVVQFFTSDQALLSTAILSPFDLGTETRLYDATYQAVLDTARMMKTRKAVIVLTDGVNDDNISTYFLNDVIILAQQNGIPIFTIGIGNNIDIPGLERLADDTGGKFYNAQISDNLRTIYQQLSSVLFENQYVLNFQITAAPGQGFATDLRIGATSQTISGEDTKISIPCQ